jgi:hypothetical protein
MYYFERNTTNHLYLKPLFTPDLNLEANNKSFRVFLVCMNTPLIPEEVIINVFSIWL